MKKIFASAAVVAALLSGVVVAGASDVEVAGSNWE